MTLDQPSAAGAVPIRNSVSVRLYVIASALVRRTLRVIEAVHSGLWLGLLDADALDLVTQSMYIDTKSYCQSEYNQSGFTYWEEGMISRHFDGVQRVLVAAAGGGREMIALAHRGIHADGFDPDPRFVGSGQKLLHTLGLKGELRICPPGQVPQGAADYDAAIIGWNAYTHIPGRRARTRFLQAMAARLRPGGRVFLSFFQRSAHDRPSLLTWRVGRVVGALRLRPEPVDRGDSLAGGFFHYFSESELAQELQAAGLNLIEFSHHPQGHAVASLPGK